MVDGIPHCDCSVRGMPSQDLEGTAPHRSPLSRIQILSSLNGLLLDLERDIFNRRGGYVERSELNKVDYDEIFKWTKDEVRGIQVEYFHEGSKPLTAERICLMLMWIIRGVSNDLKDEVQCFCTTPKNIIRPFLAAISCPELSLDVSISSLEKILFFLESNFIDRDKRYLQYLASRISSALRAENKTRPADDGQRDLFVSSLFKTLQAIVSKDPDLDIFDLCDLWSLLGRCIGSHRQYPTKDKVLSMIEFMTPKIIRRFEKNWEAVKIPLSIIMDDKGGKKFEHKSFDGVCSGTSPLKNTNTRPGNEKYKYGMFDAYMDSAIQDIRYNRSLFVRTCRSVSGGEDSDAYDDKDSVHLSLLDPLFGVFQTEDESGPHQSSLYRSRPEILNDTVYSSPKVGLEVEKPPDTNHLKHCGRQERSFSEMLIYPVTYCPIYEGLQYRRHCSLCDTATIALIFNYIVETLRNHKDADEQLRGLSLRLLDLLVKHGHQTLDKIISLGQAVFLDRRHIASHLPPTPNSVCFAIRECPQLSDLGNSNDYFSLKKNLWKNLIRCSEMLLSCLLKTYKLLQYDLFTILYEDLLCIQSYSNNANVRQSFTGEEILFMGNIFSSDMIHLLWTHMEWYLIWIIRNFTINAVIDDPIAVSILGMNTRIHSLETRRGNPGNIGTNVHIFDLVLASASMIFSNPRIAQWLYAKCDSNENFYIYVLEDFIYFLAKIVVLYDPNEDMTYVTEDIGNRCSGLLLTILYQTQPEWGSYIDINTNSNEKIHRSKKLLRDECILVLNLNIDVGLNKLCMLGFIPKEYTEGDIVRFFYSNPSIDRFTLWSYLSKRSRAILLDKFVSLFDFSSLSIHTAIRLLAERVLISGEAQQISRLIEAFSSAYFEQNKESKDFIPKNKDSVYILAYSIILLNTDLHNRQVYNKMTFNDFKLNLRGMNDKNDFPSEFLYDIFDNIRKEEICGSLCEYEKYFAMSRYSPRTPESVPCITDDLSNVWRREISDIIWRPVLASIHTSFKRSRSVVGLLGKSETYRKLLAIAAAYKNTELSDTVVYSLVNISNIVTSDPMSVLSHQEKYGHYGNAGEFSGDGTAFLDISAHLDTWVMTFGACPASQLATVLLFQIPGNSFDFLEEAWAQFVSVMQILFFHALLPKRLMVQSDLIKGETAIELVSPPKSSSRKSHNTGPNFTGVKDLSYFKNSISKVFGISAYQNSEFSPVEKTTENIRTYAKAVNCISNCKVYDIVESSRYYSEKSLALLCDAIIDSSFINTSPKKNQKHKSRSDNTLSSKSTKDSKASDVHKSCDNNLELVERLYHPAAAFNLNLLYEVTSRNMDKSRGVFSKFEEHALGVIENASACPDNLLLSALTCLFSLILKLLCKDNLAEHAISLVNKVALISEIKGRRARNIIKAGIYMVLNHRTATRDPVVYRDLEVKMIFEHLFGTNPNEWESCYKALADGLI